MLQNSQRKPKHSFVLADCSFGELMSVEVCSTKSPLGIFVATLYSSFFKIEYIDLNVLNSCLEELLE